MHILLLPCFWEGFISQQICTCSKVQICHMKFGLLAPIWPCCCCYCQIASVMSNSVRPHGLQPTRLLCPWDSPGKNAGVDCHFLLQCMKVKSQSEVAQSCLTLSDPMDFSLPGSSIHGIFQARPYPSFNPFSRKPMENNKTVKSGTSIITIIVMVGTHLSTKHFSAPNWSPISRRSDTF